MLKEFFENIKRLNNNKIDNIDYDLSDQEMILGDFRLQCYVVTKSKYSHPNISYYYIDYKLDYIENNVRYLLDEGSFVNYGDKNEVVINRRFPNFLKVKEKSKSKFIVNKTKAQNEKITDVSYYKKFTEMVNDIVEDLSLLSIKIPNVTEDFREKYLTTSKLVVEAFLMSVKEYVDNLNED